MLIKQDLDTWLNQVDYSFLNSPEYIPTEFSLKFMNFIKLVNGVEGESHLTPPVHLKMLDKLTTDSAYIANLIFRGAAKALDINTKLLTPDGFVRMRDIQVGDTVIDRNGQPTKVTHVSDEYRNQCYRITLNNGLNFIANEDHLHVVKRRTMTSSNGVKQNTWYESVVDTKKLLEMPWYERQVTKANPSGREPKWFIPIPSGITQYPSKDLPVDPYLLGVVLGDGNISNLGQPSITVHEADLDELLAKIPYEVGPIHTDTRRTETKSFRVLGINGLMRSLFPDRNKHIPEAYLFSDYNDRLALLRGLMDTDGTVDPRGYVSFCSTNASLIDGVQHLVSSLGGWFRTKRHENAYKGYWNVSIHLETICPFSLVRKAKRWADGVGKKSEPHYAIVDIQPVEGVVSKCISVDSPTKTYLLEGGIVTHNTTLFMEYFTLYLAVFGELPNFGDVSGMIYVSDSMENGVKSARKNIEFRYQKSDFLKEWVPDAVFTDPYLYFKSKEGHELGVRLYGAKTGLRGTKIFGKRPVLCVLDDLVSDDDSKSQVSMNAIKDTVYKGVNHALDPTRRKIIFNGTPFNKQDILIEAVESGAWDVNVYPVCEKFPCERKEFRGAWEDRFSFDFVKEQYEMAVKTGKLPAFNQELMLRLTSAEDRLIQDEEIRWYDRAKLLETKHNYNFYITTDFATSTKQTADYSVISVWAYNANGDWFWVDGICERQKIDITFNDLFRLVQKYKPQAVGIEITGQQQAYITWLQKEMMERNIWFNFASSEKSGTPGIRPSMDKLSRLNLVVPWFAAGKMYFPQQMKSSVIMGVCMEQISLTTKHGIKGKDDFLDTISMLGYLTPWKPAETAPPPMMGHNGGPDWDSEESSYTEPTALDSYIV